MLGESGNIAGALPAARLSGPGLGASTRASHCRSGKARICYKLWMHPDAANPLLPLVTLAAGVFLLIAPRIVSVAVAVYLIIAGLLGLNGIYHFFK
jgi:hypothetical protein